jgi:FAD binding domain
MRALVPQSAPVAQAHARARQARTSRLVTRGAPAAASGGWALGKTTARLSVEWASGRQRAPSLRLRVASPATASAGQEAATHVVSCDFLVRSAPGELLPKWTSHCPISLSHALPSRPQVLGSGIAGLTYALQMAEHGRVVVVSKEGMQESNTQYAQARFGTRPARASCPKLALRHGN